MTSRFGIRIEDIENMKTNLKNMFNKLLTKKGEIRHKKNTSEELQKQQTYCIPIVKEIDRIKEAFPNEFKKDHELLKDNIIQNTKNREVLVGNIPVSRVRPNPHQHRKCFDEGSIEKLAETIKIKGLIQPIVVRFVNAPEAYYEVIAGERRLRAVISLGMETIPAVIRNDIPVSDTGVLALIENLHREDLSVIDKALGFYALKQEMGSVKTTAEILCVSEKTIDRYLRIAKTVSEIPEIGEVIKDKNMDFSQAFNTCKLGDDLTKIKEQDPEKFSVLIQGLKEDKASLNTIKNIQIKVDKHKEKKKTQKIGRKNFWLTNTELGLNLKAKIKDAPKPEIRDFIINEVRKFLRALGVKSFDIEL